MAQQAKGPLSEMKPIRRWNRNASNSVLTLATLYGLHYVVVIGVVAPAERLTSVNVLAVCLVAIVVLGLLCWSAIVVRRGGRLWGAVVLSILCLAGAALGAVLAASSILAKHPGFVALEIVIVVWGIVTLGLLTTANRVRMEDPREES